MNRKILVALLVAGGMFGLSQQARAQFYPGYGYGGWGGMDGSAALLGADYRQATAMQLKAQNMQAGQQAAMGQNYVVQSGIRNMMATQAQNQTNANISQQQSNQDWWFQQQSQQMAQRRAMDMKQGVTTIPAGFGPSKTPPPVSTDIIKWPMVLQEPCFATERAKIEGAVSPHSAQAEFTHGGRLSPHGRHGQRYEGRSPVAAERRCADRRLRGGQEFLGSFGEELTALIQPAGTSG